ncbi:MAG: hypothetical protein N3B01_11440 [Verrucomicrobiae bacterium]|nr:hypothetical protein [Verrucomicrobiae bacterium]
MKTRWLCLFLVSAISATAATTPQTVEDVMKFAAGKSVEYKTWTAEMLQKLNLMGIPLTLRGQTWFKAPRLSRTEMEMPLVGAVGKMTTVLGSDGVMWQEMDLLGHKKVTKINMNTLASNLTARSGFNMDALHTPDPVRQWENTRQYMDYSLLPTDTIEGQPMWVLEAKWKSEAATNPVLAQQAATIGKMRVYIGQQDGFTHRIEQFDKTGTKPVVTIDFRKIKLNETLDDTLFQYKPPAGVEAIDMTEMSSQLLQQGITPPAKP